jgi:glycosyltransferase involved in cell wall biosynthesis
LLIDVNCKHSSTGKIVYGLYSSLKNLGHNAAICYGRGSLIKERNVYKFGIDTETFFHAFMTRITGLTGCFSPLSTLRLLNCIKKFNPDVVHIHELHAYFVNIAPLIKYLKKNNIKTVWTFHCEFMYTGKCGHAYDCEKWKTECRKCPQLKEYPSSLLFDFTKRMFKWKKRLFEGFTNLTIVTPSNWLAERVKQSFLKDKDVRVVHNGIDTKVFYPRGTTKLREMHNITNEKVVLAVAPDIMSERKGGRWVLKLAEKFKGEKIKFILIGVKDIQENFDHNVIALPRIANQKVLAEYYSMADLFAICSKKENFPTTCIEALCCGTPVVGFDEGGTGETAPDEFGKFVQYGDIDGLKKNITVFFNGELSVFLNGECLKYAKRCYSSNAMITNYMKVYQSRLGIYL